MKSIGEAMPRLSNGKDVLAEFENRLNNYLNHPEVKKFLLENPEISYDKQRKSMSSLHTFVEAENNCENCSGLNHCKNMIKGHKPVLKPSFSSYIEATWTECKYQIEELELAKKRKLFKSYYVPKEIKEAKLYNFELDTEERINLTKEVMDFVECCNPGENGKGLYLYGKFGAGKSFLCGAIANLLAEQKGIESLMIYE